MAFPCLAEIPCGECGIDLAENWKCGEPHSEKRSESFVFSKKAMSITAGDFFDSFETFLRLSDTYRV